MHLAASVVLLRAGPMWVLSYALIVGISIHFARPQRPASAPLWFGLALLAAQALMWSATLAIATVTLWSIPRSTGFLGLVLGICVLVGFIWFNSIADQFGQNLGYRWVGAKIEPIRWISRAPPRASSRRKRKF